MNGQARGRDTEERACAYLESRDLRLVARNHCCLFVEIDSNIQGGPYLSVRRDATAAQNGCWRDVDQR
jgi:Holliday junction resolvase-like predicted endonuclease